MIVPSPRRLNEVTVAQTVITSASVGSKPRPLRCRACLLISGLDDGVKTDDAIRPAQFMQQADPAGAIHFRRADHQASVSARRRGLQLVVLGERRLRRELRVPGDRITLKIVGQLPTINVRYLQHARPRSC